MVVYKDLYKKEVILKKNGLKSIYIYRVERERVGHQNIYFIYIIPLHINLNTSIYVYTFMAETLSVTISTEQKAFLKDTGYSASKILQQGINALMCDYNQTDLKGLLDNERAKTQRINESLEKMRNFLEKKELVEEFFFDNEVKNEGKNRAL